MPSYIVTKTPDRLPGSFHLVPYERQDGDLILSTFATIDGESGPTAPIKEWLKENNIRAETYILRVDENKRTFYRVVHRFESRENAALFALAWA